jgi:hypothetical protein
MFWTKHPMTRKATRMSQLRHLFPFGPVSLASGTYRLSQPLVPGAQDSGTNRYDVVWTAAPGACPVLSGATRISGSPSLHVFAMAIGG